MGKRASALAMVVLLLCSLCGCWNYRGLDQMGIVVGIAIDFDKQTNRYRLSYEIADLMNAEKKSSISGRLTESEGKTLFDAARNAKRKEADKLFFGSAHVVIIGRELAREEGILNTLEWFLRDGECRETMCVALSQENTARAILEKPEKERDLVAASIYEIITEDSQVTSSSIDTPLYRVYNTLRSTRNSTMLPALHKVKNGERDVCESNGIAVFKGDRLAGFLNPEQSKYALMVENKLKGGLFILSIADKQKYDVSLEIFSSKSKKSFRYEKGKVTVLIETDSDVSIAESHVQTDVMDEEQVKKIEGAAAGMIERSIKEVIAEAQTEYQTDLFGFGEMIYKRDLNLWKKLAPDWEKMFPTVEIEVSSKVHVINSAFIK